MFFPGYRKPESRSESIFAIGPPANLFAVRPDACGIGVLTWHFSAGFDLQVGLPLLKTDINTAPLRI
jgi:hypothetical protein